MNLIGRRVKGFDLLPFKNPQCSECKGTGTIRLGWWCTEKGCVIQRFKAKHGDDVMDVGGKQHWRLGREPKQLEVSHGAAPQQS